MRVLLVNNFVRQGSGIDTSVRIEARALRERGHDVVVLSRDNHGFDAAPAAKRAAMLASSLYSFGVRTETARMLSRQHIDIVHLHNLVPFVTGAVYDACREHRVATVQHLRNYRAFCLSSYGYRDGHPCDECWGSAFLACVAHRCYRDSYAASAGLVGARWIDWARGRRNGYGADRYIANSEATRLRHIARGLPAEAVRVLHNPAEDLTSLLGGREGDGGVARAKLTFVGSLLAPKGPQVALDLAAALTEFEVHFVGTGADEERLRDEARSRRLGNVVFHGLLDGRRKAEAWADSFLTLVPSLWDEPFGLVVPESYSLGVPVLSTGRGGLAETLRVNETGLLLDPGRLDDAAAQVRALWRDRPRYLSMRAAARMEYDAHYSEASFARGLEQLLLQAAERTFA